MAAALDPSLIGLIVSGDLGPATIYTSKRLKKIWFPITSPPNPPSALQQWTRQKFAAAAKLYRCLTPEQRNSLKLCCKKLRLVCTAPALWTCLCFQRDESLARTFEEQSGLPIPRPSQIAISS